MERMREGREKIERQRGKGRGESEREGERGDGGRERGRAASLCALTVVQPGRERLIRTQHLNGAGESPHPALMEMTSITCCQLSVCLSITYTITHTLHTGFTYTVHTLPTHYTQKRTNKHTNRITQACRYTYTSMHDHVCTHTHCLYTQKNENMHTRRTQSSSNSPGMD